MKKLILLFVFACLLIIADAQPVIRNEYPVYRGTDLGLIYSPARSVFRIWSPGADSVELILFDQGSGGGARAHYGMKKSVAGTWVARLPGNQKGMFYDFRVRIGGIWSEAVPDPYAKIVGLNGKRAMIGDLKDTDPAGWSADRLPAFSAATDAIVYELHIRDASISANSGIRNKGLYGGLAEKGTHNAEGLATGLDHLKELGITHLHLLPFFDYNSVDESNPGSSYNWGYDPLNYNVPEGSYSANPADGLSRIRELKKLIKALHQNGLRVVMDVVYNHTALSEKSNFNQLVPDYYYRVTKEGNWSNATACGNETASERPMFRKFMMESMEYWVREYHVDGFRVDLMGVHDIQTMNLISRALHRINPGILLYGEGWTAGSSPIPDSLRAIKKNVARLDHIAVFSDDIRDGIKGSVFDHADQGFASGKKGMEESIKFGVVAACRHSQVDYQQVNYSKMPYALEPYQTVTYCECHDNHSLWDKLAISAGDAPEGERREMQKLALAIVLTSQGISFLHAGTEFLRSKRGVENSFASPDSVNAINWQLKSKNQDVFEWVKALVHLRKSHPAFRMKTGAAIAANIHFAEQLPPKVVAYTLNGATIHDRWKKIFVVYNGSAKEESVDLPTGVWQQYCAGNKPTPGKAKERIRADPRSCSIFFQL